MRKIHKIRKKHDTGECCDLEHVDYDEPPESTTSGQ
jgi:hypothetical protein